MKAPNLLRKVKIEGKWQMLPVATVTNPDTGQMRHDLTRVLQAGKPVVVTAGTFYLEYREDGRKVRRAIGDHPLQVKAALATQAGVLKLRKEGLAVQDAPQLRSRARLDGKQIRAVVDSFIKTPPLEYRPKTFSKYRNALQCFAAWTRKTYVAELERDDIKAFMVALVREDGLDVSTAVDKAAVVLKIMRDAGAPIAMRKGDWPKVTERQPEIYRPETLKKLFAAAGPLDYVRFQTFLLSGFREMEVAHLTWDDFDPKRCTLRVRKKLGFDPKTYTERTVPIPHLLVNLLRKHHSTQIAEGRDELYVFPTGRHNVRKGAPGGQADQAMLDKLKLLAFRAGLNCGRCAGRFRRTPATCATAPICTEFGLHRFRHTYATTLLREGVDLKSLQMLLGHKDLESTEKYLRALEPEDLLEKINKTNLASKFV